MTSTPSQWALIATALVTLLFVARVWHTRVILPRRASFDGKHIKAWLDHPSRQFKFIAPGTARVESVPFGQLACQCEPQTGQHVREVHHEARPGRVTLSRSGWLTTGHVSDGVPAYTATVIDQYRTGNAEVTITELDIPGHFHRAWTNDQRNVPKVTAHHLVLPNSEAKALVRWLRHQAMLWPDATRIRKAWEQSCRNSLEMCRRQRVHSGRPAMEFHRFDASGIRYLCIETDGSIHFGRGDAPLLVDVTRLTGLSEGIITVCRHTADETVFYPNGDQVHALQKLARAGKLVLA
jgi:hypothetical protein